MQLRTKHWYVAHFEVVRKVQIHYYYYYYYYRRYQRFLTGAFSGSATICYAEIGCLAVCGVTPATRDNSVAVSARPSISAPKMAALAGSPTSIPISAI